uniref:Uncharacterized protein n=1 Tax=Arundo donax TaxID=35708 RepID=A0A0A9FFF4_ARUDO
MAATRPSHITWTQTAALLNQGRGSPEPHLPWRTDPHIYHVEPRWTHPQLTNPPRRARVVVIQQCAGGDTLPDLCAFEVTEGINLAKFT